LTQSERESTITQLYKLNSMTKLTLEAQMNILIKDELTTEIRNLLLDIIETSIKLLKDRPLAPS